jgi:hypothetical protein
VSYYALFKGMAASKPTSQLSTRFHILSSLKSHLGTLAVGLGCFPLDDEAYPSPSDSRDLDKWHSEFRWIQ